MLVEYVHGDFLNVVGFPLNHFCKQLDVMYSSGRFSSAQGSLPLSHTTLILTQDDPSAQSDPGSTSCGKRGLSASPSAGRTQGAQNSPSASPTHKVSIFYTVSKATPFLIVFKSQSPCAGENQQQ